MLALCLQNTRDRRSRSQSRHFYDSSDEESSDSTPGTPILQQKARSMFDLRPAPALQQHMEWKTVEKNGDTKNTNALIGDANFNVLNSDVVVLNSDVVVLNSDVVEELISLTASDPPNLSSANSPSISDTRDPIVGIQEEIIQAKQAAAPMESSSIQGKGILLVDEEIFMEEYFEGNKRGAKEKTVNLIDDRQDANPNPKRDRQDANPNLKRDRKDFETSFQNTVNLKNEIVHEKDLHVQSISSLKSTELKAEPDKVKKPILKKKVINKLAEKWETGKNNHQQSETSQNAKVIGLPSVKRGVNKLSKQLERSEAEEFKTNKEMKPETHKSGESKLLTRNTEDNKQVKSLSPDFAPRRGKVGSNPVDKGKLPHDCNNSAEEAMNVKSNKLETVATLLPTTKKANSSKHNNESDKSNGSHNQNLVRKPAISEAADTIDLLHHPRIASISQSSDTGLKPAQTNEATDTSDLQPEENASRVLEMSQAPKAQTKLDIPCEYVVKTYTCQPVHKHQIREARVGTNKTFECQVIGFPQPVIRWFKDNTEITEDLRYRYSHIHSDGVVSMHIDNIRFLDQGVYECRAENCEGYAITTAKLQVKK